MSSFGRNDGLLVWVEEDGHGKSKSNGNRKGDRGSFDSPFARCANASLRMTKVWVDRRDRQNDRSFGGIGRLRIFAGWGGVRHCRV